MPGGRQLPGLRLWQRAGPAGPTSGGDAGRYPWRAKQNVILPCEQRLPDGSYLSRIYPTPRDRRHGSGGVVVRVIAYTLEGVPDAEPLYRPATTIRDPAAARAAELAALYPQRWKIETVRDEFKTHLRGPRSVLRSQTPAWVQQEFYGLLLAHFALRGLMHAAALKGDVDPHQLSFTHAVRVVRRKRPHFVAVPPSRPRGLPPGRAR